MPSRTPWCSCGPLGAPLSSTWAVTISGDCSKGWWSFFHWLPFFFWGHKGYELGFASTAAALLLCPVVSEPATLFSRMYAWTERSVQNCFSFLDFFFPPFNQVGLIVLSQQLFLRWAFCQFYSLVSCINHIAHLRSQQSATQTALKSRTFLSKHIHLSQGTDGRTNPAFARSHECAALF